MKKAEVKVLSPNSALSFGFTAYYDLAEDNHFWMQGRTAALMRQLKRNHIATDGALRGIEIGCGHGVLRAQVERCTPWVIDGADLDMRSLEMNPKAKGDVFLYNILEKRPEFKERYDFIFLFDVIEHIKDVNPFMHACLFHLKPGGMVYINVPALQSLFSAYDTINGHFRRYDTQMMVQCLKDNKLEIIHVNYWGLCFVPLLWMRKMFIARETDKSEIMKKGFKPTNAFINECFKALIKTEIMLFPNPILGTSVMAIARKVNI